MIITIHFIFLMQSAAVVEWVGHPCSRRQTQTHHPRLANLKYKKGTELCWATFQRKLFYAVCVLKAFVSALFFCHWQANPFACAILYTDSFENIYIIARLCGGWFRILWHLLFTLVLLALFSQINSLFADLFWCFSQLKWHWLFFFFFFCRQRETSSNALT